MIIFGKIKRVIIDAILIYVKFVLSIKTRYYIKYDKLFSNWILFEKKGK